MTTQTLHQLSEGFRTGVINAMSLGHALARDQIIQELNELYPGELSTREKFYLFAHGITVSEITCSRGNIKLFHNLSRGFRKFCGNADTCACNLNQITDRQNRISPEKRESINKKRKSTSLKKYGFEIPSQSPEVKKKTQLTCLEKYGTRSPTQNPEILAKSQATCLKNHGVPFPQQSRDILEASEQTFQQRYGVKRPAQNASVQKKMSETNLEKYGVPNAMQSEEIKTRVIRQARFNFYDTLVSQCEHVSPGFSADEYSNHSKTDQLAWTCLICQKDFFQEKLPGREPQCPECFPEDSTWGENLIENLLKQHNVSYEKNTRKIIAPYELDFHIPELNLAIEFNGTYWHSELAGRGKGYHVSKYRACKQKNIRLIQIFEHELKHKQDIVFSRLQHHLAKSPQRVGARKLLIQPLEFQQARDFFNQGHLQGNSAFSAAYGLFQDTELVSAMSFIKSRFSKKLADWELLRFANKPGWSISGAAGKLFSHAVKQNNMKSVVSYADLRWGSGELYQNLGFTWKHDSAPNYWYFKSLDKIHSRVAFQKHKLPSELHHLGSEWTIMQELGYNRFWDCGNSVWVWTAGS